MKYSTERAEMMKKGPNDMSGFIWALGVSNYFISSHFCILSNVFMVYIVYDNEECDREGRYDKNRPKRCQTHCLGPR